MRSAIALIILLLLVLPEFSVAGGPVDLYPALMDTLVGGHFGAADTIAAEIARSFPGHPGSIYAWAALRYAHMLDQEDTVGRAEFLALTDSCVHVCDRLLKGSSHPRAELWFLKGSALSSRAMLFFHEGRALPALRSVIAAKGSFDEAIAADSAFYDAYLGRGAYRYGVARYADLVSWLPFIPSLESGWQDLWLAVQKSRFSRFSALTAIVWFVIEDQNYALADSICRAGLERFPNSRNFLWPRLAMAERRGQWAEADTVARQLLEQYLRRPDNNGYETTGLYWRLMLCADSTGRPRDAVEWARAGLSAYRSEYVQQRRTEKIRAFQRRLMTAEDEADPPRGR
jgi:tetratricopeptide (TPR) repeat protein